MKQLYSVISVLILTIAITFSHPFAYGKATVAKASVTLKKDSVGVDSVRISQLDEDRKSVV